MKMARQSQEGVDMGSADDDLSEMLFECSSRVVRAAFLEIAQVRKTEVTRVVSAFLHNLEIMRANASNVVVQTAAELNCSPRQVLGHLTEFKQVIERLSSDEESGRVGVKAQLRRLF